MWRFAKKASQSSPFLALSVAQRIWRSSINKNPNSQQAFAAGVLEPKVWSARCSLPVQLSAKHRNELRGAPGKLVLGGHLFLGDEIMYHEVVGS